MKAIEVKILAGMRFKAVVRDGKSLIESRDYSRDFDVQARELCERYIKEVWEGGEIISGFGVLPNGNYVCTVHKL